MNKLLYSAIAASTFSISAQSLHAATLLGIDVSAYQGTLSQANWNSVKADGVAFAYAKATTGYEYSEDATFPHNMTRGKAAGLQMGPIISAIPMRTLRRRKLLIFGAMPAVTF